MLECPISSKLKIFKGKWRINILICLKQGPKRYNQLKFECNGITNTMLNRSLKELENFKYIDKQDYSTNTLHVEYSLTEHGKETLKILEKLNELK